VSVCGVSLEGGLWERQFGGKALFVWRGAAPWARWRLESGKSLLRSAAGCVPLPLPSPLPGNGGWVGKYLRGSYRCRRRYRYRCRCLKSPIGGGRGWGKRRGGGEPKTQSRRSRADHCYRCRHLNEGSEKIEAGTSRRGERASHEGSPRFLSI
jgi:hypothetical protein